MSNSQPRDFDDAQSSVVDQPEPRPRHCRRSRPQNQNHASQKCTQKCSQCRNQKTKCLPIDRPWPGQKCDHCNRSGKECGPNMSTKEERAAAKGHTNAATAPSDFVSPSSLGKRRATFRSQPNSYEMNGGELISSSEENGSAEGSELVGFDVFHHDQGDGISEWGRKLDYLLPILRALRPTNTTPFLDQDNTSGQFTACKFSLNMVVEEIEKNIRKHVRFAESAYKNKDNFIAASIYRDVVFAVKESEGTNAIFRCEMLSKAALFFGKIGNGPRLQQVLEILTPLALIHNFKQNSDPVQRQARCYVETSEEMSSAVARKVSKASNIPLHFPAVHQSLHCGNTQVVLATLDEIRRRAIERVGSGNSSTGNQQGSPNWLREDPDYRDTMNRSPLFLAVILNNQTLCEALIERGARIDSRDWDGHTILEVAAGMGYGPMVHLLISHAEDKYAFVNAPFVRHSSTALQAAAAHGLHDIVRDLHQYGALAKTEREYDGKTAAQLARENGHEAIANELDALARIEDPWFAMSFEALTTTPTSANYNYTH